MNPPRGPSARLPLPSARLPNKGLNGPFLFAIIPLGVHEEHMKIRIFENESELAVDIRCESVNDRVLKLREHIELFDRKLCARSEGETRYIPASEVLYFESVDERTFLYTDREVFEIKLRLYELEDALSPAGFLRVSKSAVVNLNRISSLRPELNRNVIATMENGERVVISRSYVKKLRSVLEI